MDFDELIIVLALAGIGLTIVKTPALRKAATTQTTIAAEELYRWPRTKAALATVLRLYPIYGGWTIGEE